MKGLILATTLLAVVVVACGGSEDPTKRPPEAESSWKVRPKPSLMLEP